MSYTMGVLRGHILLVSGFPVSAIPNTLQSYSTDSSAYTS